jgi:hypothetical protein
LNPKELVHAWHTKTPGPAIDKTLDSGHAHRHQINQVIDHISDQYGSQDLRTKFTASAEVIDQAHANDGSTDNPAEKRASFIELEAVKTKKFKRKDKHHQAEGNIDDGGDEEEGFEVHDVKVLCSEELRNKTYTIQKLQRNQDKTQKNRVKLTQSRRDFILPIAICNPDYNSFYEAFSRFYISKYR